MNRPQLRSPWLLAAAVSVGVIAAVELAVLWPLGGMLRELGAESAAVPAIDRGRMVLWGVAVLAGLAVTVGRRAAPSPDPMPIVDDRWMRTLLDSMSEAVVALASDGRVVFANATAMHLLGLKALPDGTPMMVLSAVPRLRSSAVQALRHHEVVERELVIPEPRRELLLRATPTADGVVLVMLDLSGVRDLEARWRRFVADASHELRTPIAAVAANLEMLEEHTAVPPERRARMLAAASRQAQRLTELVEELTLLVHLDEGAALDIGPVAIDELVRSTLAERGVADPDGVARLQLDLRDDHVLGEAVALRRVLANLVSNALRYSAGPVLVRQRRHGDNVHVEVVDEGPGIPDADKERVFDRFVRTDEGRTRAAGGTGLGLAIVRELVDGMNGQVVILDHVPHGTVLRVTLPAAPRSPDPNPTPRPASART